MDLISKNAKLGDGHLSVSSPTSNARAAFNGKNVEWVSFKRDLAIELGYKVSRLKEAHSGYHKGSKLVKFSTKVDKRLTSAYKKEKCKVIELLTKEDLVVWYIDDGSWHKNKKTMHLYCNMLTGKELNTLISLIDGYYGVKPTKRLDKKKDGREYPYLYFPRKLVELFKVDVKCFLEKHQLNSLLYKIGETSETIREE